MNILENLRKEEVIKPRPKKNNTNKGRDPSKSYVEGIKNIESWRVNKSKDKITRYGQDWYQFPNHKMEGKFDGMYMYHPTNKHDEWDEEKKINK